MKPSSPPANVAATSGISAFYVFAWRHPLWVTDESPHCRGAGVLLSSDGPDNNVLKIKPLMPFAESDADRYAVLLPTPIIASKAIKVDSAASPLPSAYSRIESLTSKYLRRALRARSSLPRSLNANERLVHVCG